MAKAMSGSGGFYKYRCKYFYAKSCQNWVYVNGEACITCLAEGCDAHEAESPERSHYSPEACYPVVHDRILGHGYEYEHGHRYTVARGPDVEAGGVPPAVAGPAAPRAEWGRHSFDTAGAGNRIVNRGGPPGEYL